MDGAGRGGGKEEGTSSLVCVLLKSKTLLTAAALTWILFFAPVAMARVTHLPLASLQIGPQIGPPPVIGLVQSGNETGNEVWLTSTGKPLGKSPAVTSRVTSEHHIVATRIRKECNIVALAC